VLVAAKLLYGKHCNFINCSLFNLSDANSDLLIMINWIHSISPEILEKEVLRIKKSTKYLLVDSIYCDRTGYDYFHDFSFIENYAKLLEVIDCGPEEGRYLKLYEFQKPQ
jgi:hypothetical protein